MATNEAKRRIATKKNRKASKVKPETQSQAKGESEREKLPSSLIKDRESIASK